MHMYASKYTKTLVYIRECSYPYEHFVDSILSYMTVQLGNYGDVPKLVY